MYRHVRGAAVFGLCAAAFSSAAHAANQEAVREEIVVTGTREGTRRAETPAAITVVSSQVIDEVKPGHPSEILGRVPGVSVQQTNGEGHITGIRQPIGTAAVYLYLEDGIPVRASGFFNHNALYETNLPQAGGIEVIRGPGTSLYGSDAIGGIVNVLTRAPSATPEASLTLEGGEHSWLRALGTASSTFAGLGVRADVNVTHSDGWRDRSGYDRQTASLRFDTSIGDHRFKGIMTGTQIDQQTGANSYVSRADYLAAPTRNYTPFAFRKVDSFRASLDWQYENGASLFQLTPYTRWSRMNLLATFLLGFDPTDATSGYKSFGALAKYRYDFDTWRTRIIIGADLEKSPGYRREDRLTVTRAGPVFTGYANVGRIYDYDVTFWEASPYVHIETSPVERLRLVAGVRYDTLGFDYATNLAPGNFVTPTPSGNRTFSRPGNTNVDYSRASPSVGATYQIADALSGFLSFKQSFRVPQESQLFRPGTNFDSLGLKPVEADSYEVGLRGDLGAAFAWDMSFYRMIKRNDILTLTTGTTPSLTNNGKTRHTGVELGARWNMTPEWQVDVAGSYSRSRYLSWTTSSAVNLSGKIQASAPDTVANATLAYTPAWLDGARAELEWSHLGAYWLDDANTAKYGGHELFNLRAGYDVSAGLTLFARATNLLNRRWATAAQISGGAAQYAPGMPFTLYGGATVRF
jgi:outer membrane receptor protein involved in Fe transport